MAYDLALRRQSPKSFSRGDEPPHPRDPNEVSPARSLLLPTATGLAATALVVALLGGTRGAGRRVERTYYRATRRDLARTQETPAVTMSEMVYGRK
jgi:hypothetical protein